MSVYGCACVCAHVRTSGASSKDIFAGACVSLTPVSGAFTQRAPTRLGLLIVNGSMAAEPAAHEPAEAASGARKRRSNGIVKFHRLRRMCHKTLEPNTRKEILSQTTCPHMRTQRCLTTGHRLKRPEPLKRRILARSSKAGAWRIRILRTRPTRVRPPKLRENGRPPGRAFSNMRVLLTSLWRAFLLGLLEPALRLPTKSQN